MGEWFGLEWWRYAWGPALAAGLVWLASTWKTAADSRGARDARLDVRQDKWIAVLDAEIAELKLENERLREDRDRGWDVARGMEQVCHDRRHEHINVLQTLISLRRVIRNYLRGIVDRDCLEKAVEGPDPLPPPPLPSLAEIRRTPPA